MGARSAGASWISRHIFQAPRLNIIFNFAQNVIEIAGSDVALGLFIPLIVFPAVQPGRKLGAFVERELFDGTLDLGQAHEGKL